MELYWILRLPQLHSFFDTMGVLLITVPIVLFVLGYVVFLASEKDYNHPSLPWRILVLGATMIFIGCFIPTKLELSLMMGWDALHSDSVQEVIEILKDKLL